MATGTALANDSQVNWKIDGLLGKLEAGPARGSVELNSRGQFQLAQWHGRPLDGLSVLGTDLIAALEPREQYVRGCDLVATFGQKQPGNVTPQAYWRARWRPRHSALQLELILSVQTDLLDSRPETSIHSTVRGAKLFLVRGLDRPLLQECSKFAARPQTFERTSEPQGFLFQDDARGFSYFEMVHPSDFVAARLAAGEPALTTLLFPERLEKGVIRRARISGWFLPASVDPSALSDLAREFIDEDLPLTA